MGRNAAKLGVVWLLFAFCFVAACGPTQNSVISTGVGPGPKPILRGVLVRQTYPGLSGVVRDIGGLVQSVPWSDIQPSQGGPIAGSRIDRTIAFARANNLTFKLRVNAGIQAPGWAKVLGGAPVTVHDPQGGAGGTIGRFWTAAFGQAYSQLQAELAARYDNVAQVAEVVITRCTTVYGEPFLRQGRDVQTVTNLLAAGYTAAADAACQQQQIVAHRAWLHTRSGLAFNPYDHINANGTNTIDLGFTEQMMLYCRQQLGSFCVLENDSIRWPTFTGKMALMYSFIRQLGAPISFQSANPPQIGDPIQTLHWAASMGANSVELSTVMPGVSLPTLVTAGAAMRPSSSGGGKTTKPPAGKPTGGSQGIPGGVGQPAPGTTKQTASAPGNVLDALGGFFIPRTQAQGEAWAIILIVIGGFAVAVSQIRRRGRRREELRS